MQDKSTAPAEQEQGSKTLPPPAIFYEMLKLQNSINCHIDVDWRQKRDFPWYRAVWMECSELIEHLNWKWWRKSSASDLRQLQYEVVDIWHFGLSTVMMGSDGDYQKLATDLSPNFDSDAKNLCRAADLEICSAAESLAAHSLTTKDFSVPLFVQLASMVKLGGQELYACYVGKNILNTFRQDHGYKTGTYRKQWGTKEDNEHLAELVESLRGTEDFVNRLYQAMSQRYRQYLD